MVVVRLARGGSKKRPFYHIVAADKRDKRDGRFIERLGFFNPLAQGAALRLEIKRDKLQGWVSKGAQMSDRVKKLVAEWDKTAAAA